MPTTPFRKIELGEIAESHHPVLVLVRHGQSQWNKENRFTGWIDVDLSEKGVDECTNAAEKLADISFQVGYTSKLLRAARSLELITGRIGIIPVVKSEALNERHYGDLQGMNKDEARERFGAEQIHRWRRGFADRPPNGESLEDTCMRTIPFFESEIVRDIELGRNVLVVAHGNSLRAIVMHLEGLSRESIIQVEIPTAAPICYTVK